MSGVARIIVPIALVAASFIPGLAPIAFALRAAAFSLTLSTLAGRPRVPHQAINGNIRGSTETHLIVLGERRVGGKLVQLGQTSTSGSTQDLLWIGIAHSVVHPGGCEGLIGLYVNDEYVPAASLGSLTGSTDVTHTGSGSTPVNLAGQLNVAFYRGTGTQAADSASVTASVDTSTDYRRGICWSRYRLRMDGNADRFRAAYPNGVPTFTSVVRGWRVYDPRLDSTAGGSGSHRANNPLTWTWSRNPALQAATYAIVSVRDGGCGEPIASQDWASVAAAANICDELISTPAGNQPRYACDIVLDTADKRAENLQKILDCMGGSAPLANGVRRYYAGAYRTPTTTIDESWLRGAVQDSPVPTLDDIANRIVATFPDGTNSWTDTDTPEFAAASPLDSDGDPLVTTLALPGVTRPYAAQYLAQVALRRSRRAGTLNLPLNLRGLDVMIEENVLVNLPELGLVNAVYRVVEWRWDDAPSVVLRADAASDYTPAAFTIPPTPGAVTVGGNPLPGAPQTLTAVGITGAVALDWLSSAGTRFADPLVPVYLVERSYEDENDWVELTRWPGLSFIDSTVTAGDTFDYRVRGINARGQPGPASNVATAGARQPSGPVATAVANPGFEEGPNGWIFGPRWSRIQRTLTGGGRFGIVVNPARTGLWSAVHTGAASTSLNEGFVAVSAGSRVTGTLWFRRDNTLLTGSGFARINWYDALGVFMSSVNGPTVIGSISGGGAVQNPHWTPSIINLTVAPAGAAFARLEMSATDDIRADDGSLTVSSVDNLDDVPDSATFARILSSQLTSGSHKLTIAGSGVRVGDGRNLPAVRHGNIGAQWSAIDVDASWDTATPANLTLSVSAGSLQVGTQTVSFGAASVSTTQLRGSTRTWRLYFDSPSVFSGGTFTLNATTSATTLVSGDNRLYVGVITITIPGGATGGTGGGVGGGGGYLP